MQGVTSSMAAGTIGIVFAAAVLRGMTGFGFALAAVPMLGILMPPATAVPVAVCIVAVGGLFGAHRAMTACHWPSIQRIALAAAAATPVGTYLLKHISPEAARISIGFFTLAAVIGVSRAGDGGAPFGPVRALSYGLAAGLFNGMASMPGPPVVAYFMSSSLSLEAIRASMLIVFQITVLAGLLSALALGLVTGETLFLAAISLPAFWIGNWSGGRLFALGSERTYRRIALACLIAMAIGSAGPALIALMRSMP